MNQYNAARAAGYSETTSRRACTIEQSVKISMADSFEQAGLTDKAIVAHALQGLNAMKLQSCNILVSKAMASESVDADSLVINKNSNDFIEVEDWNARHKYFETILKLTDRLKEATVQVNNYTQIWAGCVAKSNKVDNGGRIITG